jgi:chaperonin GroEL (HSP60 family)
VSDDLVKAVEVGIVDPVKVTKTALRNACSISALLSTCGGAITFTRPQQ